jgi:hypothetical protein
MNNKKKLNSADTEKLLSILKTRFEKNMNRHKGIEWAKVQKRLESNPEKMWSLNEMEKTGGEPDLVAQNSKTGDFIFYDCSPESPAGRRSYCYDQEALEKRKANKPLSSAVNIATVMGIQLLTEDEYSALQKLGNFDSKTSSWLSTPSEIRKLGGAIYADYRYGRVFIGHNGADSYYSSRGFRGKLIL